MKKIVGAAFLVLFVVSFAAAQGQCPPTGCIGGIGLSGIDILGAHQNGGRGCAGCHAPHSGAAGGGGNPLNPGYSIDTQSGSNALFGQDVGPLFNQTLVFGQDGNGGAGYIEVLPSQASAYSTNTDELRGIMMCLACHDGAIAKGQMMSGYSWEQTHNLLPTGIYGPTGIPTLLGNDSGDGNISKYGNDHPVGTAATLGALRLVTSNAQTTPLTVTVVNNAITNIVATPGTSYATFAANYGFPAIAGSAWGWGFFLPEGSTDASKAFMTCTTCHNQHVMYIYKAPSGKQGGSKIAGGTYPTYFFVNAPYNPGAGNTNPNLAAATTQFCRQCHIGEQNEAYGVNNVQTAF